MNGTWVSSREDSMKSKLSFVALFSITACVSLSNEGRLVKIVSIAQVSALQTCQSLGGVDGSSENAKHLAVIDMKNKAAVKGGNVILSSLEGHISPGWINESINLRGQVYRCPLGVVGALADWSAL